MFTRNALVAFVAMGVVLFAAVGGATAASIDVSGDIDNPNGTIGVGNTANMIGDTKFGWQTGNCAIPVVTNGFVFTLDSGNGNLTDLSGAISGNGGATYIGRYEIANAYWNTQDLWLSGADANTYTGASNLTQGSLHLNKSAGVDAISGGPFTVGSTGEAQVYWLAGNQIADSVDVILAGNGTLGSLLNLDGFSDTVNSLTLSASNSVVNTGDGGVLTVSALTVGGTSYDPGVYDSSYAFVEGTGHVLVQAIPEPSTLAMLVIAGIAALWFGRKVRK